MLIIKTSPDGEERKSEVVHIGDANGLSLCKWAHVERKNRRGIDDTPGNRDERILRICSNCKAAELTKNTPKAEKKTPADIRREADLKKLAEWIRAAQNG